MAVSSTQCKGLRLLLAALLAAAAVAHPRARVGVDASGRVGLDALAREPDAAEAAAAARLEAAKPLAWLHIPKCGTSQGQWFLNHPGICPNVPDSDKVAQEQEALYLYFNKTNETNQPVPTNITKSMEWFCPGALHNWAWHQSIMDDASFRQDWEGHGVTMVRDPPQRMISMLIMEEGAMSPDQPLARAGETVQLDGTECAPEECTDPLNVKQRVLTARQRLRAFAFVGLTEQWALSVCLFHVKFGGRCWPSDFTNTHPGNSTAKVSGKYDVEPWLDGDYHFVDSAIYREAFNIFHADLRRFNVTEASCRQCFQEGDQL